MGDRWLLVGRPRQAGSAEEQVSPLASGGYQYSLGVAHAVQHHLPSTARGVAVVEELVKHPIIHLGGQVSHKQRVHLSKPGEEASEETSPHGVSPVNIWTHPTSCFPKVARFSLNLVG